jgi:phospholipid transport system transporter-binding protein
VNDAAAGEVLKLDGALTFESLPAVLAESAAYAERPDLPDKLTIDFSGISHVDSSAVALLLEWRRQALKRGKNLQFVNLPDNLMELAELYGVADLILPHRQPSAPQSVSQSTAA